MANKKIISILFISILVLSFFSYPKPVKAFGFVFGGHIEKAEYEICTIYVVPFPLVQLTVTNGAGKTVNVVYLAYAFILQAFGVANSLYNYYQLRSGVETLGQYIPLPIPWTKCSGTPPYPTNLILKIGTSLY